MRTTIRKFYEKEGNKWVETYATTDPEAVYESLSYALAAKYISKSPTIRSIKRVCNYDGTITFTIYYRPQETSKRTFKEKITVHA